jgi:phage terminase large subunit-like protein
MWPKANPRVLTNPVLLDQMRREYADYKLAPLKNVSFMTKRMNLPPERKDVAVTAWENLEAASRDVGDLEGLPCVCGIDYAKTTDMIGACLLFHDEESGYRVISHGWFCENSSDAEAIKAPLDEWERMGLLTIVHDVEVSPETVTAWVAQMAQTYDIRCVSLDNYRITLMKKALAEVGFKAREKGEKKVEGEEQRVWLTRPSDIMRVQPVIDSAFATHSIAWGENPLMRWATNNAKLVPAPHDNFTYGKIEPHGRKTDPFMALVAAFAAVDKLDLPKPTEVKDFTFIKPLTF